MAPSANPIDLTLLANVKTWVNSLNTSDDQTIQDAITAFSAWVLKQTGRGPTDGSIPTESPFSDVVTYDEFYDGNGNDRLYTFQWPIEQVNSVAINGVAAQASTAVNVPGYVIDQSKKCLVMRGAPAVYTRYRGGGRSAWSLGTQNVEINYNAGFSSVPFDLEFMARKIVGRTYKGKGWIGQHSQAMAAGAGTIVFDDWILDEVDRGVMNYYQARVA